ncbi:hypothetical protein EF902_27120 [Streptomyces sp. WAC05858]|nr:hypothetical protein EF902_27120 [Streptomyces sp. WAC05858]
MRGWGVGHGHDHPAAVAGGQAAVAAGGVGRPPGGRQPQAEWFAAADDRLGWGGDVVGGWYLRGTGFASVQVVACTANRIRPTIPCPMR